MIVYICNNILSLKKGGVYLNIYTFFGAAIDLSIAFYLYKIYGKTLITNKFNLEIIIDLGLFLLMIINTCISSIDATTLLASTITASAIGIAVHLLSKEAINNEKHLKLPFKKKEINKKEVA